MIVYVDGMCFRKTGIGKVLDGILEGLAEERDMSRVQTVVPRSRAHQFSDAFPRHPKLDVIFADFEPFSPQDFVLKHRVIARFPRPADVSLFPNVNVPLLLRGKLIITINDVIMMTSDSSWSAAKRLLFRTLTARALSRSSATVYISEFTRREVERAFGARGALTRIIYPGLGDDFLDTDPDALRKAPLIAGDYILHVGSRVGHKNHRALIRGWLDARARFPRLKLVVAGSRLWEDDVDRLRRAFALGDELIELRHPTDDEVKNLYANARALVFPSLVEGFGIPPLEAMAMGLPVVCSDIPVFREVYGDSVCYLPPQRAESIAEAVGRVLTDPDLSLGLAQRGRERAARYRRARSTAAYLDLIKQVCPATGTT